MKTIAIIPARGGSKRLPGKNIKPLGGQPLIAYSIQAARKASAVDAVIVSTDSADIARVAKKSGAWVPFIRPANLATDTATTIDVLIHAVEFLKQAGIKPDHIVLLQPTSPFISSTDIDQAVRRLHSTKTNSCVSLCPISERPEWMFIRKNNRAYPFGKASGLLKRSQDLPDLFRLNGALYVVKTKFMMKHKKIIDVRKLSSVVMPVERSVDIDTMHDFNFAKILIRTKPKP